MRSGGWIHESPMATRVGTRHTVRARDVDLDLLHRLTRRVENEADQLIGRATDGSAPARPRSCALAPVDSSAASDMGTTTLRHQSGNSKAHIAKESGIRRRILPGRNRRRKSDAKELASIDCRKWV